MLIRKVEIHNFKRLVGPIVIDGLGNGINIISGDNEEGKSTVLAAIKAAIFQKHSSGSQTVKDFRPYNSNVRPEVSLAFDYRDKHYSIRKGFCSKSFAEFRSVEGLAQGLEAEEKIRELFGLNVVDKPRAGSGAAKPKSTGDSDAGIWGLLWLEQGAGVRGLDTTEVGKETLMRALDGNLTTVIGGERGRALQKNIAFLHGLEFSASTGKVRGELKNSMDSLSKSKSEFENCKANCELHQKKLQVLSDKQAEFAKFERDKTLETARAAMEKCAADLTLIERLRLELDGAQKNEKAASLEWTGAKAKLDKRQGLSSRVQKIKDDLLPIEEQLLAARESFVSAEAALSGATAIHEESQLALLNVERLVEDAQRADEIGNLRKRYAELLEQIASLEAIENQLVELEKQCSEITLDESTVTELRALSREMEAALVRSSAAATKLVLQPLLSHHAVVNGEQIDATTELSIFKKTNLKLEGWGEIEVTPGGEESAKYAELAGDASRRFEAALLKSGAASLDEAEEQLRTFRTLALTADSLKKEKVRSWGSAGLQGITKNLAEMESQIAGLESAGKLSSAGVSGEQKDDGAQLPLATLKANYATSKSAELLAKGAVNAASEGVVKSNLQLNKLETQKTSLQGNLSAAEQELQQLPPNSADALQAVVNETESAMVLAAAQTRVKANELDKMNEAEIRRSHEEFKRQFNNLNLMLTGLNTEITRLAAEINAEGQSGLGEQLHKLQGELQIAESKFERLNKNAQAIKLLHETLLASQEEGKSQILLPVLDILRPQLAKLFPDTDIVLDHSKIEISQLSRGGVAEPYTNLSMGTREQLSVLTRIAVAQLLKKQGQPCAVLLDDALVNSDETRIARMKEILQEVAVDMQVIILTCRLKDYSDMAKANIIELAHCGSAVPAH